MINNDWTVIDKDETEKDKDKHWLSVASVQKNGAIGASILQALAYRVDERCDKPEKYSDYYHENKYYISYPVGIRSAGNVVQGSWTYLSNFCPWISSRTFERELKKLKLAKQVEAIPNPDPDERYKISRDGKVRRNPYWYTVPDEVRKQVLCTKHGSLVNFSKREAVQYGLTLAILWNKVCWFFDGETPHARRAANGFISLAPRELSKASGLTYGEVQGGLAKLVELGSLTRLKGSCRYCLNVKNPLEGMNRPAAEPVETPEVVSERREAARALLDEQVQMRGLVRDEVLLVEKEKLAKVQALRSARMLREVTPVGMGRVSAEVAEVNTKSVADVMAFLTLSA